jgi:UDP-N-acetyl-D-mannosaminuronic acid dehydrogenase
MLEPLGVGLAYCPERILQGFALEELLTLPQIVSGSSREAIRVASALFQSFSPKTVEANFLEAELSKLFLNSYRYTQFAVANEFYRICNESGVDFEKIRSIMSSDYPRGKGIPKAGLSAGPCLLKDTQQLLAFSSNNFHIGYQAISSNEGLAIYIVDKIAQKYDLANLDIGILGMAFKANIDDIRSSLSYKIRKILQFKARNVFSADKFVSVDKTLISEELLLEQSSIIIIGTPHDHYASLKLKSKVIIDIWGVTGGGVII